VSLRGARKVRRGNVVPWVNKGTSTLSAEGARAGSFRRSLARGGREYRENEGVGPSGFLDGGNGFFLEALESWGSVIGLTLFEPKTGSGVGFAKEGGAGTLGAPCQLGRECACNSGAVRRFPGTPLATGLLH